MNDIGKAEIVTQQRVLAFSKPGGRIARILKAIKFSAG
jgi:hypothetical protein